MRDALSIMDQAIASAPTVEGGPALSADEVRGLMGTVSNAIYEQILEAVHDNNSADVLAIIGRLLDAGNGAQQLARQFVRYLRNCTVAKITNLSPEADRAPASPPTCSRYLPRNASAPRAPALLFTEEELSRFLQHHAPHLRRPRISPGAALPPRTRPPQAGPRPAPAPSRRPPLATRRHQIPTHPNNNSHKPFIIGCHGSGCPIFADSFIVG